MRFPAMVLAVVLAAPAMAAQQYQGAWFTIEVPDNFTAMPGLPSTTGDGFDSARFSDPAKRVEFYVYSPQAGGAASDLVSDPSREDLIARQDSASGERTVRWSTYRAKDRSYLRSVEEMRTADGLQDRVYAITYRNTADLQAFRQQYLRFKESLKQLQD